MNASIRTPAAIAMPICWMNGIELVENAPMATASRIAAAVTTRPVRGDADGDGLALGLAAVARLLDAAEQEHAVVGGEREDQRRGDQEVGRLDAAVGRVAEQALEAAVLVDQHERASAAPTVSAFITMAFSGSTIEPVISHSTRNVSPASRASGERQAEAIAACWSMNSAAGPVTWARNGARRPELVHHARAVLAARRRPATAASTRHVFAPR